MRAAVPKGVGLVRMVEFDDFDRLEEPCRLLREMHGQHGADREVRRDEHRDLGLAVSQLRTAPAVCRRPVVPTTA